MAKTGSFTASDHELDPDAGYPVNPCDGVLSFVAAGAVLFASLVVGSWVSLILAGSDAVVAAILRGFLLLGVSALGGFLAAAVVTIAVAAIRTPRMRI